MHVEKPQVRTHYLKGSVFCGQCGEPLSLEYSRNRVGTLYRYFYCLGRQGRRKNGCTFRAVQVHVVEQLIEDYWATVTLSDELCHAMREVVMKYLRSVLHELAQAREKAERKLAALRVESSKVLQAHYADAIDIETLKAEQQRIALAKAGAERQLTEAQADHHHLERQLDRVLTLLCQAHRQYLASPSQARRDLNQGMFTHIYLDDDEVVGSDLTPAFQHLLGPDLEETLADELKRAPRRSRVGSLHLVTDEVGLAPASTGTALPARHRRTSAQRLNNYLRVERPAGPLAWEKQKNLCPRKGTGSNVSFVLGSGDRI